VDGGFVPLWSHVSLGWFFGNTSLYQDTDKQQLSSCQHKKELENLSQLHVGIIIKHQDQKEKKLN
jgi:hypothetical protein